MPTSSNSYATISSREWFHHCLVHETVAALFRAALNRLWDKFMGICGCIRGGAGRRKVITRLRRLIGDA